MKNYTKKLVLEDGSQFYGYGFGADRQVVCELVFNTSIVGYQEILSDPSYMGQMVVMKSGKTTSSKPVRFIKAPSPTAVTGKPS